MTILTLSGWTQPAEALSRLISGSVHFDYSEYANPEASFEGLKQFEHAERIVAWSMGGQLALRAIAAGVLNPKKLTLIAAPYQFVGENGMDDFTFTQFRANYETSASRSKTRFHGLIAKGDKHHKRIVEELDHHHQVENIARWLPWLDDLSRFSFKDMDLSKVPTPLIIHGVNDVIVPIGQSEALAKHLGSGIFERWEECGHAPHLHDTKKFTARLNACQ